MRRIPAKRPFSAFYSWLFILAKRILSGGFLSGTRHSVHRGRKQFPESILLREKICHLQVKNDCLAGRNGFYVFKVLYCGSTREV